MNSPIITTNAIARQQGQLAERQKTAHAIVGQIASIKERIETTTKDDIKLAWTVAIIELEELARTLGLYKS